MEVAIGANGSTPFQHEVREWQRVDPNTGALMSGRLEADRWINGPLNAYGKVVDSQNVSKPNGTQHTQRKQLEVLQARTSSGSLQVVRAQTVQTSSSRWSSSSSSSGTRTTQQSFEGQRFSNGLHLTNGHLLDGHDQHQYQNHQQQPQQLSNHLSSRLLAAPSLKLSSLMKSSPAAAAATNGGGRVSPHFQQLAGKQHQQPENETTRSSSSLTTSCRYQPTLGEVRVGVGGSIEQMESFRNEREIRDSSDSLEQSHYAHLPRGKSISTDDLSTEWDQNEEGDESSEWRRVSKIRRSFQFPKSTSPKLGASRPPDLPENSVSVSRIREELENGRRLSTAMRNNNVDLAALSNILNGTTETGEIKGTKKTSFLTAESLKEIRGRLKKLSDESLYKDDFITQKEEDRENDIMTDLNGGIQVEQPVILQDAQVVQQPDFHYRPLLDSKLATNSLENHMRYRDTASSEWHLRRKSYGFEKMTPQDHSIFRSEPSTDSGIGRSGELSNWSPTEAIPRTTIIKFGENSAPTVMSGHDSSSPKPLVPRRYSASRNSEGEEVKRHSIAVDESKYVRDNLRKVFDTKTSIHLNGLYLKETNSSQVSIGEENGRKQKRVEFCKTEVHFAAESGRVNIVETDGKPPPTNNFRRRRRGSGGSTTSSYLDAMNSGMPVIHFGDEKKTLFEQETAVEEIQAMKNNVTVSLAMTNGFADPLRDDDDENSDEISLRGILKNKPIKPKPYHLGENVDSKDNLWGVRLRPVVSDLVTPKANEEEDVEEPKVNLVQEETPKPLKSVAERVRIVEERKDGSGYSTKINLNLSNSPYAWNPDSDKHHPDPIKPLELRIQEHTTQKVSSQADGISEGLKSTSLIMKTIKSAGQFDEAMKRLNQSDTVSGSLNCSATKLISSMNAITKSSSANSIFQEPHKSYRSNYSSSLDGDIVLSSDDIASQKVISSSSFSSSSSSSFVFDKFDKYEKFGNNASETVSKPMEPLREEPTSLLQETPRSPIAAPRIKVIGSSSAVSHQLSQLRRMYDATDFESDDSARADEEVKRYLGGGGSGGEFSGSWSRLKVQRSNNKKQLQNDGKAEVRKSNVMSIDLNSPIQTAKKAPQSPVAISVRSDAPVAHPRTVTSGKITRSNHNETTERNVFKTESLRSPIPQKPTPVKDKEPLKVVTGGARKLREHELSYFGVKVNNCEEKPRAAQRTATNPEANRKPVERETSSKWNLPSNKPDLLRHSPDGSTNTSSRQDDEKSKPKDGPIYENLKKPSSYSRKKDLQRDEMILNEMTKTADQTLKAVSGNSSQKDHPRRTPQRSTRPLDTIQEVLPSHTKHHQKSMKSKAIQVSRVASEGFQRQCCSNRPSSASSTESLSRLSNSSSVGRSRSRSRDQNEKVDKIEYAAVKQTKKVSSADSDCTKVKARRSTSHASSSEDLANLHHRGEPRKVKRSKPKEKESSTVRGDVRTKSSTSRAGVDTYDRNRSSSKTSGYEQVRRSHRSMKDEQAERVPSSRAKASSSASDYHQKTHTKSPSAVIASTRSSASSSKRPIKVYSTRK